MNPEFKVVRVSELRPGTLLINKDMSLLIVSVVRHPDWVDIVYLVIGTRNDRLERVLLDWDQHFWTARAAVQP